MPDDKFKGSVEVDHPEDKKQKLEVKYQAETDKDGQITITIQVEGEKKAARRTIKEGLEESEREDKAARRKLQKDIEEGIKNMTFETTNGRIKTSDKNHKSVMDFIKG